MGLVYLSPLLENIKFLKTGIGAIDDSLLSTISAIIATLPLILSQFGRLSIVAPIVNVLILWTIPYLMLFSFTAVILSFVFFPIGQLVAWITWAGLFYVVKIVSWFSSLSFAAIDLRVPWFVMIVMYAIMLYAIKRHNLKKSNL
jgi:competence protein ComEC